MYEYFFCPRSLAVIGASRHEEKIGHGVLKNIIASGYQGKIYPINPAADQILDLPCYPSILQVPHEVEMAVVVVPGPAVAQVLEECGQKEVKGAVIISAGFREVGGEGMKEERRLVEIAQRSGMRLVGPNCLGVIDTACPLNATFARGMPPKGHIAFMSQSGALMAAILDWAASNQVGFSRMVSLGNKADLNEVDFLEAWAEDPSSRVIACYLEGIAQGERFLGVARRVTQKKPIIAIKAGTSQAAARAVSSHTGTLAGSEWAYQAALDKAGVIRADSVEELFDYAMAFAQTPARDFPSGRVAIVTNAGGPAIMAADAIERAGLKLASFSTETIQRLRERLPEAAPVLNPVDCLGDSDTPRYRFALETVLQDENVEAAITIFLPQIVLGADEVAQAIGEMSRKYQKPVLACFMGEDMAEAGIEVLRRLGVPNYSYPERAAEALAAMFRWHQYRKRPPRSITRFPAKTLEAEEILRQVREKGRLTLGDEEARRLLTAYGIPVPRSELARTAEEAVAIAEEIGFPVALKIASPDILHKTDIGGVRLNVSGAQEVGDSFDPLTLRAQRYMPQARIWGVQVQEMIQEGREVLVGMSRDPHFGPLLAFGLGGIYVEVLRDVSFRLAPLSRGEAEEMIASTRAYWLLRGVRGEKPGDLEALVEAILRVSQLVTDFPQILELDINPLLVLEKGKGIVALDARMVLEGREEKKPQPLREEAVSERASGDTGKKEG